LSDRGVLERSISGDLEFLNTLHRLAPAVRGLGDESQDPTVWEPDTLELRPVARASGPARIPDVDRRDDPPYGLASGDGEAGPQGGRIQGSATPPDEGRPPKGAEPPTRIGKYLAVERLGEGGQAQVFRVLHPELAKDFVLKLSRRPIQGEVVGQAGSDRLLREGRMLAACDHPNLVRVVDLDVHEGRLFLVMEYVPGMTLDRFVNQVRPGPHPAARLVAELARAVAYLHDRGIIHQDIKPQNVLIDDRGQPRLIDLGLARLQRAWSEDTTPWTGGTAGYMSPEQAMNHVDGIGPCTDVFGLGGLLYHLLTGRPLYRGASRTSVLRQAIKAEYVPVRQVSRRAPRALVRICEKALAADPRRRYRTARELEDALRWFRARRRITAVILAVLAATAVALVAPRPWPLGPGPAVDAPASAASRAELKPPSPTGHPPRIVSFVVDHSRGDPPQPFGPIGLSTQPILLDDDVRVSARFDAPAYCYLIALNPDGEVQPCHPDGASVQPSPTWEIAYPSGELSYFPLTDAPGLQAFVLLASRTQLPPYAQWKGIDGLSRLWRHDTGDRVWRYDGRRFEPISSLPRGEPRKRSGPPSPFQEVCKYLAGLPEVETVQAIAFPVRPKR
jgi:serine/threonine protein kinase